VTARLVAALALVAGVARADRVVRMDPPVVRACRSLPSWDKVETCLTAHGTPKVIRTLPHARLIRLLAKGTGDDLELGSNGLYLYVDKGKAWQLGGTYFNETPDSEVLGASEVTVNHHVGYRIDIGQIARFPVSVDGVTSQPAVMTVRLSVLCSGDTWQCVQATTACDVLVHGKAQWTFRGVLTIADNQAKVTGDAHNVGTMCPGEQQLFLGWADPTQ